MVGSLRLARLGSARWVAVLLLTGILVLGWQLAARAQDGSGFPVDDVVASVLALPALSTLTAEQQEELQSKLQAALEEAIAEDAAAGVEVTGSPDSVVAAVEAAAEMAGGVFNIDDLVAAAVAAYRGE